MHYSAILHVPGCITRANLGGHRFRHFWMAKGQISSFPWTFNVVLVIFWHYSASV